MFWSKGNFFFSEYYLYEELCFFSSDVVFIILLAGHLFYKHRVGEGTGTVILKFTVSDQDGNDLIDQHFYITVLGKFVHTGTSL